MNHQSAKPNSRADTVVPDASLSNSSGGTDTQATSGPSSVEFAAAHLTPILFYGKAVDQNGAPIPDATVTYRANNIPWGGGARSQMKTDASGEFQISSKGLTCEWALRLHEARCHPSALSRSRFCVMNFARGLVSVLVTRNSGRHWRRARVTTPSEGAIPGRIVRNQEPKRCQTVPA